MCGRGIFQRLITGILIILTSVYLIIGLIVVGLTLWLRFDSGFEEMMRANILRINNHNAEMDEIKEQIRYGLTISFWVICGCGLATTLIGLLGLCGVIFRNRLILILNLITSVILMTTEIVIVVFIFLCKPMIEEATNRYINLADQLADFLDDMNTITTRYKCCSTRIGSLARCITADQPTCMTAVWYELEYNLILAGYFMAGIIIKQILTIVLCIIKIAILA